MSRKVEDLTGNSYSRLVVLGRDEFTTKAKAHWVCECTCGSLVSVRGDQLRSNITKSCGCLRVEACTSHGMYGTRAYKSWISMNERCHNKNHNSFKRYGGRGVLVCEEWSSSFENFYEDMGERPVNMTLDRKDNNKNYTPDNCKWSTLKEQSRNRRDNVYLMQDNCILCIADWADKVGIPAALISTRIRRGWSVDEALFTKN